MRALPLLYRLTLIILHDEELERVPYKIESNRNANRTLIEGQCLRSNIFELRQILPKRKMFPVQFSLTAVKSLAVKFDWHLERLDEDLAQIDPEK